MAATSTELKRGTRVVVTDDIPGVPEGTAGKVGRAVGFTLARYRVRFDNKVEVTSVAGDKLVPASEWDAYRETREAERAAAAEAAATAARAPAGVPAPAAAPAAEGDSGVDPRLAALMAKSKAAKEGKGIVDEAPAPAPAEPAPAPAPAAEATPATPTAAGGDSTDASMDPRLAALTAKSRAARVEAGVDLDAEDNAPADEPAPAAEAAPAPAAAPEAAAPEGPDLGDGYFPVDNRVADLLGKVNSGELGQP